MSASGVCRVTADPPAPPESPWVAGFEPFEHADGAWGAASWVLPLRKAGLARFASVGLPTTRDEDWRHTSLAGLADFPFRPATPGRVGLRGDDRNVAACGGGGAVRLVFLDGHFAPALSSMTSLPEGLKVLPLSAAMRDEAAAIRQHVARFPRSAANPFASLNDAYFTDGLFVRVAAGVAVETPIEAVFLSNGAVAGRAVHPRHLIVAGKGSRVTVVETYEGQAGERTLTVPVTELTADEGAAVEHLRIQDEAASAFHLGTILIESGPAAQVTAHSFALGAGLSRQQINATLTGERAEVVLNGLYLARGGQHVDHHMRVDHARAHTTSHESFHGVLAGNARAVFHGRILVRRGAQKTDAKQTNRNLLLSDQAMVNSKPQLEIYADDVRCTHGATMGPLNPEWLFYLRSRGIPEGRARAMLVEAFAGEILDRVQWSEGRERLRAAVGRRFEAMSLAGS